MRYYSLWYYSNHLDILAALEKDVNLRKMGKLIRETRKTEGLSQEQLALMAGVDRSYLGGIERGERNVSFLTLVKIAACLHCDVARFTKGIPNG